MEDKNEIFNKTTGGARRGIFSMRGISALFYCGRMS